jgi:hypothetical protein
MNQKPTVNRNVHYYAEGNSPEEARRGPFAALITSVRPEDDEEPNTVDLVVFYPGGTGTAKTNVKFSETPTKHCWSWPPRA